MQYYTHENVKFRNGQEVRPGWLLALYHLRDFRVKTNARFTSHTQLIATEWESGSTPLSQ